MTKRRRVILYQIVPLVLSISAGFSNAVEALPGNGEPAKTLTVPCGDTDKDRIEREAGFPLPVLCQITDAPTPIDGEVPEPAIPPIQVPHALFRPEQFIVLYALMSGWLASLFQLDAL